MNMTQIVALSDRLASMALQDYDALLASNPADTGPDIQRLVIRTVAQAAAIRALELRR